MCDLYRVIYLADAGRIMYFNQCMSVYRLYTHGSWSENTSDPINKILDLVAVESFIKQADKQTKYRWHKYFKQYLASVEDSFLGVMSQFYRGVSLKKRFIWLAKWTRDCFGLFPYWVKMRGWISEWSRKVKIRALLKSL